MGIFLRWGVFAILAIAALVYAYNASKRLSERQPAPMAATPPVAAVPEEPPMEAREDSDTAVQDAPMPEACAEELLIAERALKMRRDGEPLDQLLRLERIAFVSDEARRTRLESVARQWFEREGRDPDAARLHADVLRDCQIFLSRAPEVSAEAAAAVSPAP